MTVRFTRLHLFSLSSLALGLFACGGSTPPSAAAEPHASVPVKTQAVAHAAAPRPAPPPEPVVCGGFEKLAQAKKPTPLLGGALNFLGLPGFEAQAPQSDLATLASNHSDTKLVLTAGAKRLRVHARQLFRRAPSDLVSALQKTAPADATVIAYNPHGLSGALVIPASPQDQGDDAWLVLSAYTQTSDGLVQRVDFSANKAAIGGRSGQGCVVLAKQLAEGLSQGSKPVDLRGATRKFMGHAVKLPADVVMVSERGPEFAAYHFYPVVPLNAPGAEALIYIGQFPDPVASTGKIVRGAAFGAVRAWRQNVTQKQVDGNMVQTWTRHTIVPLAQGKSADLSIESHDEDLLKMLAAMLSHTF